MKNNNNVASMTRK